jgi:hypothetical protein
MAWIEPDVAWFQASCTQIDPPLPPGPMVVCVACLSYPGHADNARHTGRAIACDFVGPMLVMKLPHPGRIAEALPGRSA